MDQQLNEQQKVFLQMQDANYEFMRKHMGIANNQITIVVLMTAYELIRSLIRYGIDHEYTQLTIQKMIKLLMAISAYADQDALEVLNLGILTGQENFDD